MQNESLVRKMLQIMHLAIKSSSSFQEKNRQQATNYIKTIHEEKIQQIKDFELKTPTNLFKFVK